MTQPVTVEGFCSVSTGLNRYSRLERERSVSLFELLMLRRAAKTPVF